jgi:hypothetical protein
VQAKNDTMALMHTQTRNEQLTLLDLYAADFDWYCFCIACGHAPRRGSDALQALYQSQAWHRGSRMRELYPLVCAHWDAVNLAHQLARANDDFARQRLQRALREAKARHRGVMDGLRAVWAPD